MAQNNSCPVCGASVWREDQGHRAVLTCRNSRPPFGTCPGRIPVPECQVNVLGAWLSVPIGTIGTNAPVVRSHGGSRRVAMAIQATGHGTVQCQECGKSWRWDWRRTSNGGGAGEVELQPAS